MEVAGLPPDPEPTYRQSECNMFPDITVNFLCPLCRRLFYSKDVFRVIIKESLMHVTVVTIRLRIEAGEVLECFQNRVHFFRITQNQEGFFPTRRDILRHLYYSRKVSCPCTSEREARILKKERRSRSWDPPRCVKYYAEQCSGILPSFFRRLADDLNIDIYEVKIAVECIITTSNEVMLDFNLASLRKFTNSNVVDMEYIINNMFWQPRPINAHIPNMPCNHHYGWFTAVDHGTVVPAYSTVFKPHRSYEGKNFIPHLLSRCIHQNEYFTVQAYSWYLPTLFYARVKRGELDHYATYLNYSRTNEIINDDVHVIEEDPATLSTNFAHTVSHDFYVRHAQTRQYRQGIELFDNHVLVVANEIPFIVRSLKTENMSHIFHLIYKEKTTDVTTYETLFKLFVLLRHVLSRLGIERIAVSKIGCDSENIKFSKLVKIVKFAFMSSKIVVLLGDEKQKCWFNRFLNMRSFIFPEFKKKKETEGHSSQHDVEYPECDDSQSSESDE